MKLIESKEELQNWEDYRAFLKLQLKRITRPEPFYVSKDKLEFTLGKTKWRGHAVLAGPKAPQCVRRLKKDNVVFREGTCERAGREISFTGEQMKDRYVREPVKTFEKLKLGYKLTHKQEEAAEQ